MIAPTHSIPAFSPFSLQRNFRRSGTFDCLRRMDLFSRLQDEDLWDLATTAREQHLEKGSVLLSQDDPVERNLFVILEGEVTVSWQNGDGFESLLATLRCGDTAGEMELFDTGSRCTTVRAASPVKVLSLHREDLLRGMREKPELALGFLTEMARRLGQSHRRMAGICHQRVPRRVACILLALMDERGTRIRDMDGRYCTMLRQHPTQRRIAELAGTSRETVSRLFTDWGHSGWFEDREGDFRVFDEERLRHLAGEG